ncbi:hypothetical protein [Candidatus Formimonas warabiya]|uniref:Nif11-like leader peptide family natural product n=1 Tax=Formimonas warabiya TaxID=1761012 RepID=A0A3G1KWL8_FORW1|nr:hypothetical protein [Candidatus Formimonas warabiya]ATW26810.1 hypothetical protein DCMF_20395 [Candidatus Formimonas warabiya]
MASKDELKKLAIKSLEDDAFRVELEKDPVKAAASIGITLSADEAQNLNFGEEAGERESKISVITL